MNNGLKNGRGAMSKQKVAVTREMCGYIEVEASSTEEAIKK